MMYELVCILASMLYIIFMASFPTLLVRLIIIYLSPFA